jgi:hypothetical protein
MSGYYYTDGHYPEEEEMSYGERMERWRRAQFDTSIPRAPTNQSFRGVDGRPYGSRQSSYRACSDERDDYHGVDVSHPASYRASQAQSRSPSAPRLSRRNTAGSESGNVEGMTESWNSLFDPPEDRPSVRDPEELSNPYEEMDRRDRYYGRQDGSRDGPEDRVYVQDYVADGHQRSVSASTATTVTSRDRRRSSRGSRSSSGSKWFKRLERGTRPHRVSMDRSNQGAQEEAPRELLPGMGATSTQLRNPYGKSRKRVVYYSTQGRY